MNLNKKKKLQYLTLKAFFLVKHLIVENRLLLVDVKIIQ